jgi:hypothetical protein
LNLSYCSSITDVSALGGVLDLTGYTIPIPRGMNGVVGADRTQGLLHTTCFLSLVVVLVLAVKNR